MSSQTVTAHAVAPEPELLRLLEELSAEEKVSLVVGASMWSTTAVPRLGLEPVVMSDGPVGVRGPGGGTSAMFPAPSALAATWDLDLAARAGALFAAEARRHGVDVVLAPQVNLQRTPVGGRHFECYSEDPHLTAEVAVALVGAAQAHGVGMCVKHYVANDSETERTRYLARLDERTLREVYLAPFERLVRDVNPWSVMGAYNGADTGGVAARLLEHRPLVVDLLKEEWGYDGLFVSDWVATQSVAPAVRGGLDLQMPGPDGAWGDGLLDAVRSGEVAESELDDKVLRLLRLARRTGRLTLSDDGTAPHATALASAVDRATGHAHRTEAGHGAGHGAAGSAAAGRLLRELAARSVVVLKDDAGLVPLVQEPARPLRVALLGPAAVEPFFQGGGSSLVHPDRLTYPAEELRAALPQGSEVTLLPGARALRNPPELDVDRCTDPVTGEPGLRVTYLAADGSILEEHTTREWTGWLEDVRPDADAVRLRATVRLDETGVHELGVGTVGIHRVRVDGAEVASGGTRVDEDVVLSSGHNHPIAEVGTAAGTAELDATLQVVHAVGYGHFVRAALVHRLPGPSAEDELAAAVEAAAAADVAVVVVGTTAEVESEGYDRPDLDLPGNQDELVRRVALVNPRTVVVVNAGAPVLLPWLADVPTVLWGWLPGQEAGTALADVLTGVTEPSGRLPWTLPARFEDVPVPHARPVDGVVDYAEGTDVGYRAWERRLAGGAGAPAPAAPFGHGLGWTTWEYEDAVLARGEAHDAPATLTVYATVRNTGRRAGREVVQVYVEAPDGGPARPVRWLGGFTVVDVPAMSSVTVPVPVATRALQVWDPQRHDWTTPPGTYRLRTGRSVADLRLTNDLIVRPGDDPGAGTR
ncbi:beta-glucosidase [Promicromonospora thailandica]|uniref:Beta-glucosidase n=1 Tax=Promicromonospora thailandica TaxID=765201 RepID=A0A9X2JUF8_9MICO|nr:glycoside hydrolase family 3 protein [Promicromonospora thailandica]MCP2263986.1 beta-glucosidase [Promicromonospora thailandica]BFF17680.1 glycoside hydrolase family 3 C-terminal domain-containing protein [Promicromonospora thailandica]